MAACQFLHRLKYFSLVFLLIQFFDCHIASSTSVRGVAVTKLSFYDSSKDFTCLDGSVTISFSSVNDDYCDCSDGTDEPGTPACANGQFHCTNAGFRPLNIPSSRVNDGICDCCDGSDEYNGGASCPNTCKELYRELYEKKRQEAELAKEGYILKQDFSKQGQEKKEERKQKLEELKQQLENKKATVEGLKAKKEEVEVVEKEAKEKHEQEWEETKAKILAEKDKFAAEGAFRALDADGDGRLTVQEIVDTELLDKKYNEEEGKELLGGYADTDIDNFFSALWSTVKDKYLHKQESPVDSSSPGEEEKPTEETPETPLPTVVPPMPPPIDDKFDDDEDLPPVPGDDEDEDEDEDDEDMDDTTDDVKDEAQKTTTTEKNDKANDDLKMPDYDEETKAKISVADQARKDYEDADTEKKEVEKEISQLERILNLNFGQEEEFATLHGECFEYTDREYVYKLCPFDRASQRSKDGGSETSLGTWGEWTGDPNMYNSMKYSGGQGCWNGPSRSAVVNLSCGSSNELVGATEPSRCEYHMEFKTPAACQKIDEIFHPHEHGGEL